MAIVITRWRCVQGAKYDCCGSLVDGGWEEGDRKYLEISRNEHETLAKTRKNDSIDVINIQINKRRDLIALRT